MRFSHAAWGLGGLVLLGAAVMLCTQGEPVPVVTETDAPDVATRLTPSEPVAPVRSGRVETRGADALHKREVDAAVASRAGVLGALRDPALDGAIGDAHLDAEVLDGAEGLRGTRGEVGAGGLDARSTGFWKGAQPAYQGGVGTKGRGSGASGLPRTGTHRRISRPGGDPIILGAMDVNVVDAMVAKNMEAIRACYHEGESRNPELAGKIVVKFVIGRDGAVESATTKSTTMNDPTVEGCINAVVGKMAFPAPEGGGIVIVSYPLIFRPG